MSSNGENIDKKEPDQPQIGRDLAQDIFNLCIILGLVILFFFDVIFRGQVFFAGDIMNVYTPWQQYNQEALALGRMPLWCDDFFMGFPLFAESQGALFYLPTRFVYWLSSDTHSFSYDVLLHFLLAGWFQYFFARVLRLRPSASLLSAVAFMFSGMFLSLPINFTIFRSIVWIPLIFAFLTLGARRGTLMFPLLAAVSIVLQMMGGSLQVTGITVLALVPYVFFLILSPDKNKKSSDNQINLVPLLQLLLTLMLATGLYAFQLLPTMELMQHAWRGTQGDYSVASAFSFPPEHFIDVLVPTFYGVWKDGTQVPIPIAANYFPYFGLVPFMLVLPGLLSRKRGVFILLLLVVLFLALAVGKHGLVYPAVYSVVPFFDKFRAPDRFWFIVIFASTLLAGYGLQNLMADAESEKPKISPTAIGLLAAPFFLITLFLIGAMYVPALKTVWNGLIDSTVGAAFIGLSERHDGGLYSRWQSHLAFAVLHAFIAVTVFHFAIALFGRKGRSGVLAATIVLITILDLFAISFQVPAIRTTGKEFYTSPPRTAQVLRRDGEPNRFYSFLKQYYAREVFEFDGNDDTVWYNGGGSDDMDDYMALREVLAPNIFMHWDLASSNGFASLFLERYFILEGAANQQLAPFLAGSEYENVSPSEWADRTLLIDLMASRYVLTPLDFKTTDRFNLIDDEGPVKVYRNRNAYPRAWIARPETILAESPNSLNRLMQAEIDPESTLILDPIPGNQRRFENGREGRATATIKPIGGATGAQRRGGAIRDEQVLIMTNSPDPAYLILADTYYPGWHAEVDGVPVNNIYRAYGYFRAIEIPAGEHLVRFYYNPLSFSTGVKLSVATLATFILLAFVQLFFFSKPKSKRKREED